MDLDTKNAIRMQKKEEKRSKRKTLNELTALGCWGTLFEKLFIKLLLIILFISINIILDMEEALVNLIFKSLYDGL